ncbi:inosine-uridine preferring nucleoside hydrolase-like [Artemia franciscana]|uniref:Inosine/uridine-preferring nucleoside hydrolase domain-containing protein n=1 Tax=Artemia franciscana TaxID=6661 RepID=A0AA88LAC0_ARTSF|nr:hypothetical protein QYM36_005978 [Artemia franciscana]
MIPKVIVDTDVGLDDAMALFMLIKAHKEGHIDLVAITTVHGNTTVDNVCKNTVRTLEATGVTGIPVFKGAHSSLVEPFIHKEPFHGWDGFGDVVFETVSDVSILEEEHAVNGLIRLVNTHPGEISIVAVGPLTNLALAMRMDPMFASKMKSLYIMGGNTEGVGNITIAAEFNFHCDPEAAFIVLKNTVVPTVIVAWELCYKHCEISWEWRKKKLGGLNTPQSQLLNRIESQYMEKETFPTWLICDQIAAAAYIDPGVITRSSEHFATVELTGRFTRGMMVVDHGKITKEKPNVTIVERVDVELIKDMLLWGADDSNSTYKVPV